MPRSQNERNRSARDVDPSRGDRDKGGDRKCRNDDQGGRDRRLHAQRRGDRGHGENARADRTGEPAHKRQSSGRRPADSAEDVEHAGKPMRPRLSPPSPGRNHDRDTPDSGESERRSNRLNEDAQYVALTDHARRRRNPEED